MVVTVLPARTPVRSTATGTGLDTVPPLPKAPEPLAPHAANVPSVQSSNVWFEPQLMALTVLPASTPSIFTSTGTLRLVLLPSPNWPELLYPHAASVPSLHRATVCNWPAAIIAIDLPASTPLRSTSTGNSRCVLLPSPS